MLDALVKEEVISPAEEMKGLWEQVTTEQLHDLLPQWQAVSEELQGLIQMEAITSSQVMPLFRRAAVLATLIGELMSMRTIGKLEGD